MALPAWQATIVNSVGDIIPSAEITVLNEATGLPDALFSDRAGTVPLGTLGVFPANVNGFAQFYAAPAEYRITAEDSGSGFSQAWRYVVLAIPQASPTDSTLGAYLTNETSSIGGNVNYTGANYEPVVDGLGAKTRLFNNLVVGGVAAGAVVAGTNLKTYQSDTTGVLSTLATMSGSWKNTSGGTILQGQEGDFTKVSN